MTTPFKEITSGLKFPEGPVAMPDGSAEFADLARTHFGRGGWAVAIAASLLVVLGAACAMHGCAPRAILRRNSSAQFCGAIL